jgi:drug/metabolite transporter (DMT)-like permease
MEVVFAAVFAIVLGGERLTIQTAIGGVSVVVAMYLIVLKEQK